MKGTHIAGSVNIAESLLVRMITAGIGRMHIEVLQFVTIIESPLSDFGDAFWQRELRQARAVVESTRTDSGEILQRQLDACHRGFLECIVCDSSHFESVLVVHYSSWDVDGTRILTFLRCCYFYFSGRHYFVM